jgi:hypothetical protein
VVAVATAVRSMDAASQPTIAASAKQTWLMVKNLLVCLQLKKIYLAGGGDGGPRVAMVVVVVVWQWRQRRGRWVVGG